MKAVAPAGTEVVCAQWLNDHAIKRRTAAAVGRTADMFRPLRWSTLALPRVVRWVVVKDFKIMTTRVGCSMQDGV